MAKEKPVHVQKEPRKKLASTLFAGLMALISLIAGIYLILQYYGLYAWDIPKIALIIILIFTGLTALAQTGKINTLMRLERMKRKFI